MSWIETLLNEFIQEINTNISRTLDDNYRLSLSRVLVQRSDVHIDVEAIRPVENDTYAELVQTAVTEIENVLADIWPNATITLDYPDDNTVTYNVYWS